MNWETIKSNIYYDIGMVKEIIIVGIFEEFWDKWTKYINENFKLEWYFSDEIIKNKIELDRIKYFWNNPEHNYQTFGNFYINDIEIKMFFWDPDIMVNCFWPSDIKKEVDHKNILEYMLHLSKFTKNDICLIDETNNYCKDCNFLIKANNGLIDYNIINNNKFIEKAKPAHNKQ